MMKINRLPISLAFLIILPFVGLVASQTSGPEIIKEEWSYVLCLILCVIWGVAAAIAAIVIILNGVKYMNHESPDRKNEAKKGVMHAVITLSIIIIAMPFVNYIIENTDIVEFKCECSGGIPTSLVVSIDEPVDGSEYEVGKIITFRSSVFGGKSPYTYKWTSSVDRDIGSRRSFRRILSRNTHIIRLEVTDDRGISGNDEVQVKVIIPKPIP